MGTGARRGKAAKQRGREVAKVFRMPARVGEGGAGCRLGGLGLAGKPAGGLHSTPPSNRALAPAQGGIWAD